MGVAKTNYTLSINEETCVGCGLCKKACNVTALELFEVEGKKHKKQMRLIEDNCLGCGACISACPTKSLSLVPVDRPQIPEKKKDLMKQILKEKKRLTPFVIETVKKKIKRKIGLDQIRLAWRKTGAVKTGVTGLCSVSDFATVRNAIFVYKWLVVAEIYVNTS